MSEVTEVWGNDISKLMNPGAEKRQGMAGFDGDYVDIVDYIVRCTHKIWEERGMGLIYTHYKHNVIVHTPYGTMYGRDAMLASSIFTLQAFPDRRGMPTMSCGVGTTKKVSTRLTGSRMSGQAGATPGMARRPAASSRL